MTSETHVRELLELAAKAAGEVIVGWNDGLEPYSSGEGYILKDGRIWNALTCNSDAFQLLCKRSMRIVENHGGVYRAVQFTVKAETDDETDHEVEIEWPHTPAATRLAITRAAAAFQQCKEG